MKDSTVIISALIVLIAAMTIERMFVQQKLNAVQHEQAPSYPMKIMPLTNSLEEPINIRM